jgi:hypothetical protein
MTEGGWKELLTLLLSQRLEINAIESALKTASILTDAQVKRFAHKHRTLRKLGVRKIATMFWHSFACTHRPWPPCPSRGPGNNEPASTARASDGLAQVYRIDRPIFPHFSGAEMFSSC